MWFEVVTLLVSLGNARCGGGNEIIRNETKNRVSDLLIGCFGELWWILIVIQILESSLANKGHVRRCQRGKKDLKGIASIK